MNLYPQRVVDAMAPIVKEISEKARSARSVSSIAIPLSDQTAEMGNCGECGDPLTLCGILWAVGGLVLDHEAEARMCFNCGVDHDQPIRTFGPTVEEG